jgi:hypothetical protein|tara:strand:+ start:4359 stop:5009 length:651 start_codon:yes stop_codon:yes gene_type:complete
MLTKKINMVAIAIAMVIPIGGFASDVYIDQAGSNTTIDITQTGDGNTVGNSTTASTITGDGSDIDIVQTGASNTADIATSVGTSGTIINYAAAGGSNVLNVEIDGASDTTLTTTIAGDSNEVTVCGTLGTLASDLASATCTAGIQANTTTSNIAITGDTNKVAIGAGAATAVNNITIGANVVSNLNVVNVVQTGLNTPAVTLNIDGTSNAVNVTQN